MEGYRKSPMSIPDPPWPPLPKIGGSQPSPRTSIAIVSITGKATDFKFASGMPTMWLGIYYMGGLVVYVVLRTIGRRRCDQQVASLTCTAWCIPWMQCWVNTF